MVRQPTEYSKSQDAIQEASRASTHLIEWGRLRVNAQNKWSGVRNVMMEAEYGRLSSRPVGDAPIGIAGRNASAEMTIGLTL